MGIGAAAVTGAGGDADACGLGPGLGPLFVPTAAAAAFGSTAAALASVVAGLLSTAAGLEAAVVGLSRSAICALVARRPGSRRNAYSTTPKNGSGTDGEITGSAFWLNGKTAGCCVSASTKVTPSDQTSAAGVYADAGTSGAS
jgi:hypothetical protein